MTLARTWAVALTGIAGHLIAVEADLAAGLPGTTVIGMGDAAVTQARDRIRAAVMNSGHKWPDRRIWRCRRRRCPNAAPGMTWHWRWRC